MRRVRPKDMLIQLVVVIVVAGNSDTARIDSIFPDSDQPGP